MNKSPRRKPGAFFVSYDEGSPANLELTGFLLLKRSALK
jgi:hypothetical protein